MANQYVNKVEVNGITIIDLTNDTVDAGSLAQGFTAHDKSGALITGTALIGIDGDDLAYGTNTSPRVNVAQADYAIVQDYTGTRTGKAIAELAVLSE